jgi:hypothetical protein
VPPQARPFDAAPRPFAAPASFAPPPAVEESAPAPFVADLSHEAPLPDLGRFAGPAADEPISLPVAETAYDMAPVPSAATEPAPQDSGSERIAAANLAELSPVELIERFARALKAKRHSGAIPDALLASAAAFTAPDAPAEFAPTVPEPAPALSSPPIPVGFGESSDAPAVQPLTLPTAMRPLDFSDYDEQEDQPSYVPARSINMPAAEQSPADVPAAEPQFADPVASATNEVVEDEGDMLDEGYSSLLDLSRPAPLTLRSNRW